MRKISTIILLIAIFSAPVSAQGILGVESIIIGSGSAYTFYNQTLNTANTYSSATSYLFWYPTLNGIRILESRFYRILDIPEYVDAINDQALRIEKAEKTNTIVWLSAGAGMVVGGGVMLGGISDIDNSIGYLAGGSILMLISMIPLAFLQNTDASNIVSFGFAQQLANNYNRR